MHIVYILISETDSNRYYIGITQDLQRRLGEHNRLSNDGYSKKYAPWRVETFITFQDALLAENFEKYLKRGSGFAFLKKRLIGK